MLFFCLFIPTSINSNMNLPKKKVGDRRAVVQALGPLKDTTFVLCRQGKPKGFKL